MEDARTRNRSLMIAAALICGLATTAVVGGGVAAAPAGERCWDEITSQGWECDDAGCDSQTSNCCENCEV